MKESLSIIIPAYNEEKRIGKTLENYGLFFEEKKKKKEIDNFEILVVINGTTDRTEDIVKKFSKKYPKIRYLNFKRGGKGFAIIEGFRDVLKRKSKLVGFVDADMATSPEAFYDLILDIENYDGIIASRGVKKSIVKTSFMRKLTNRGFNFWVKAVLFLPYHDTQCGAKLFKKKVIEQIIEKIGITEWAFDVDLLYKLRKRGFKIKEASTVWEDKTDSKIDVIRTSIQMFLAVMRLRILNSPFRDLIKFYDKINDWLKKKKRKMIKIPYKNLEDMKNLNFKEVGDYCHKNPLVKWLFWKRLKVILKMTNDMNDVKKVLDFGAGSGILMPTLAKNFPEVYSLDLDTFSLKYVKKMYGLKNIKVIQGRNNHNKLPFKDDYFDIIFAADVLEHFKDSERIQEEFKRILRKGGYLIVSGPTENLIYRLARKYVYKQKKPIDHYTDVYDVMKKTSKFLKIEKKKTLPCFFIPGFKIYKAKKV